MKPNFEMSLTRGLGTAITTRPPILETMSRRLSALCREPLRTMLAASGMLISPACALGQDDVGSRPGIEPSQQKCYVARELTRQTGPDRTLMCAALEDSLNHFCGEAVPLSCGLRFSPNHPEFTQPAWEEVSIAENMEDLENMVRGRALPGERRVAGSTDLEWRVVLEALQDSSEDRLFRATVDLTNSGEPEEVYQLWWRACDANTPTQSLPMLLRARDADVMTNPALRVRATEGSEPYPGSRILRQSLADVFMFNGNTFLFRWSAGPWVEEIRISSTPNGTVNVGTHDQCEFDYIESNE